MSLESVYQQIEARRAEFAPLNARVKFVVEPGGVILLDATETPPTVSRDDADAETTIRMDEDKFEQLIAGQLSPTLAYTLGQIKVEGSLGTAMKLASLLDT